jgi:transposase InsO family protein
MVAAGVSSAGCKVAVTGKRQPGAPAPATTSTNRRWAPVRAHRHRRHSRVAYAEIRDDEKAVTAIDVLRNAIAWFAQRGVTVERVLSDNGSAYKSHAWRNTCNELNIKVKKTRPYRPQTNGKIERFHRTLADGWAFSRHYNSESARRAALPAWIHHYNHHRPHTAIGTVPPISRLTNLPGQYS